MRRLSFALTFALFVVAAACNTPEAPTGITTTTFASGLGVNLDSMTKTSDGLYYEDLVVGTGTVAASGDSVTVNYIGSVPDGNQFDAATIAFRLGEGKVIAGWDQGVPGVKVGGTRLLVIPPSLGYGGNAQGTIPPNSILVFKIQLVSVIP